MFYAINKILCQQKTDNQNINEFSPSNMCKKHLSVTNKNIFNEEMLNIESKALKPVRNKTVPSCCGGLILGLKAAIPWAPQKCATQSGREQGKGWVQVPQPRTVSVLLYLWPVWFSSCAQIIRRIRTELTHNPSADNGDANHESRVCLQLFIALSTARNVQRLSASYLKMKIFFFHDDKSPCNIYKERYKIL